ncbi:hypothetical protein ACKFKG_26500 [Phormidesmis sp. 146-35]
MYFSLDQCQDCPAPPAVDRLTRIQPSSGCNAFAGRFVSAEAICSLTRPH